MLMMIMGDDAKAYIVYMDNSLSYSAPWLVTRNFRFVIYGV